MFRKKKKNGLPKCSYKTCVTERLEISYTLKISYGEPQVQEERNLRRLLRTRVKAFQFQTSVGHYLALENVFKPGVGKVRPAEAFCPARAVVS